MLIYTFLAPKQKHQFCWIRLIIQHLHFRGSFQAKRNSIWAAVISGAAIVAEVWSHMLTHVVSEWARGLGKYIWMNIDISLAPCGVSSEGMRACKTLTKEQSPLVIEIVPPLFISSTRMQYSAFLWTEIKVNHCWFYMTFRTVQRSRSGRKFLGFWS